MPSCNFAVLQAYFRACGSLTTLDWLIWSCLSICHYLRRALQSSKSNNSTSLSSPTLPNLHTVFPAHFAWQTSVFPNFHARSSCDIWYCPLLSTKNTITSRLQDLLYCQEVSFTTHPCILEFDELMEIDIPFNNPLYQEQDLKIFQQNHGNTTYRFLKVPLLYSHRIGTEISLQLWTFLIFFRAPFHEQVFNTWFHTTNMSMSNTPLPSCQNSLVDCNQNLMLSYIYGVPEIPARISWHHFSLLETKSVSACSK